MSSSAPVGVKSASSAATAAFAVARAEELHVVRDHLDRLPLRAVLRLPLAPVQPAVDADGPPLGEETRTALALVTPDGHVEVIGLLGPLAGLAVLLSRVDGEPQLAHGGAARRVPQLGVPRQVADQDHPVDVRHYDSSSTDAVTGCGTSCRSRGVGATGRPGDRLIRRVAMWRRTPSVIFRIRESSSSVAGSEVNPSRW